MGDVANEFWWDDAADCVYYRRPRQKRKIMKVRGIAYWASVQAPNTTFEPVYTIDLVVNEEADEALKKMGLKGKKTDEGISYKFKRKQFRQDGTENNKPVVVDAAKQPFTDLIGNGSEVIVQFSTFEWKNRFGGGIGADLQGVQVVNLVSFRAADGEEFETLEDGDEEEVIGGDNPPPAPASFDDDIPDVL